MRINNIADRHRLDTQHPLNYRQTQFQKMGQCNLDMVAISKLLIHVPPHINQKRMEVKAPEELPRLKEGRLLELAPSPAQSS